MKKILMTLAAVLCCAMITSVFISCQDSEEEMQSKLVGTWTESNDLYNDVLTLGEDGRFEFVSSAVPSMQTHANLYNGSGNYKFERIHQPARDNYERNFYNNDRYVDFLHLSYGGRETQTLEIRNLTSSKLEMTDRYGYTFHFTK